MVTFKLWQIPKYESMIAHLPDFRKLLSFALSSEVTRNCREPSDLKPFDWPLIELLAPPFDGSLSLKAANEDRRAQVLLRRADLCELRNNLHATLRHHFRLFGAIKLGAKRTTQSRHDKALG